METDHLVLSTVRKVDVRLPEKRNSWREAGPPHHHDNKVDSDQKVFNKKLSLYCMRALQRKVCGARSNPGEGKGNGQLRDISSIKILSQLHDREFVNEPLPNLEGKGSGNGRRHDQYMQVPRECREPRATSSRVGTTKRASGFSGALKFGRSEPS